MYFIVINIILTINGFEVPYMIYNQMLEFKDQQSCESYVKTNSSAIKNDINLELLRTEYRLKDVLNIVCLKLETNNA